jgi:hypothetical protein
VAFEAGKALKRPSPGEAAALGGASIAAAAIAIGIAQIELSGQPQPHIWSNSWLLVALALAFAGLAIAVVFFLIAMFARERRPAADDSQATDEAHYSRQTYQRTGLDQQILRDLRRRCNQLAHDIYAFEQERRLGHNSAPEYDEQTVYQYHLKYGHQELDLASDVEAMGVPREDLQLLYDQQKTTKEIRNAANFLKNIPNLVVQRQIRVDGGVTNTISGGSQYGPVLQGRDFTGLTFGPPAPPPSTPPGSSQEPGA